MIPPDGYVDEYWGDCPMCHRSYGYVNLGEEHWFCCETHRVRWRVGIALFSIPPMTDQEYAAQQERAKVVETYTPISLKETWSPPKQVADALLQSLNKEGDINEAMNKLNSYEEVMAALRAAADEWPATGGRSRRGCRGGLIHGCEYCWIGDGTSVLG